jgi:hypothetical protein
MMLRIKDCVILSLFFISLAASAPAAIAGQTVLQCPAKISTAPAASEAPEGWSASRRAKEQLSEQAFSGAAFSDGHPDELAFLRPSAETAAGDDTLDEYDLASVTPEGGAWLICYYKDTPAFLYKKLEPAPARCSASRNKADAAQAAVCQ